MSCCLVGSRMAESERLSVHGISLQRHSSEVVGNTRRCPPSFWVVTGHQSWGSTESSQLNEPHREKTGFLHMRKQSRRSASR